MKHATLRFRAHEKDYSDLPDKEHEWSSVYGEVQELMPEDAPPAHGKQVTLTHYVESACSMMPYLEDLSLAYFT